jgi:hypothetical protein
MSLITVEELGTAQNLVHQLADITNTSTALWIFNGALASARLLFGENPLQYRGPAVETKVLLDVGCGISEAVTHQFFHRAILLIDIYAESTILQGQGFFSKNGFHPGCTKGRDDETRGSFQVRESFLPGSDGMRTPEGEWVSP